MHDGGGGGGGARRAVVRPLGIYGAVRSCKRVVFDRNVDVKPWRLTRMVARYESTYQSINRCRGRMTSALHETS